MQTAMARCRSMISLKYSGICRVHSSPTSRERHGFFLPLLPLQLIVIWECSVIYLVWYIANKASETSIHSIIGVSSNRLKTKFISGWMMICWLCTDNTSIYAARKEHFKYVSFALCSYCFFHLHKQNVLLDHWSIRSIRIYLTFVSFLAASLVPTITRSRLYQKLSFNAGRLH